MKLHLTYSGAYGLDDIRQLFARVRKPSHLGEFARKSFPQFDRLPLRIQRGGGCSRTEQQNRVTIFDSLLKHVAVMIIDIEHLPAPEDNLVKQMVEKISMFEYGIDYLSLTATGHERSRDRFLREG